MQYHLTACVTSGSDSYPPVTSSLITIAEDSEEAEGLHAHDNARVKSMRWSDLPIPRGVWSPWTQAKSINGWDLSVFSGGRVWSLERVLATNDNDDQDDNKYT